MHSFFFVFAPRHDFRYYILLPPLEQYCFIGDTFPGRAPGTAPVDDVRFWHQNVDQLSTLDGFRSVFATILAADVDVILLSDVGWTKRPHLRRDVLALLRKDWDSNLWHKGWFNADAKAPVHGLFLAIRSPWRRAIEVEIPDSRHWARYGGVILRYRSPVDDTSRAMAIFVVYACPFAKCAEYFWETAQIARLADDLASFTPWDLLRFDLGREILRLELDGIQSILLGDWNVTWSPAARRNPMTKSYQQHYDDWQAWFGRPASDPFVNAYYRQAHDPTPTFGRSNCDNDMDFAIGRESFLDVTLIKAGVLGGVGVGAAPPCSSGHWPILLGLDLTSIFGLDTSSLRSPTQSLNPTAFAVRAHDEVSMLRYRARLAFRWTEEKIAARARRLTDAPVTSETCAAVEELYEDAVRCMTGASADVRAERREVFRQRMSSRAHAAAFGELARRNVLRALLFVTDRKVGAGKRDRELGKLRRQHSVLLADLGVDLNEIQAVMDDAFLGGSTAVASADARGHLDQYRASWRLELERLGRAHRERTQTAEREERARRAEAPDESGQVRLRKLVSVVKARDDRVGGKYASIVEDLPDGSREVHSDPAGVAHTTVPYFRQWMGDCSLWYNGTKLDDDTPQGRDLRQRIAAHGAAGVDLAAEDIPEKFSPVLDHMRCVDGAATADYSSVFDPFTRLDWDSGLVLGERCSRLNSTQRRVRVEVMLAECE